MISKKQTTKCFYVILLRLKEKQKVDCFYMKEISNTYLVKEQFSLVEKNPDIYSLDHWFETKEECEKVLKELNRNKDKFCVLDYYRFRFNVSIDFLKHNKRMFQKLRYSLMLREKD